LSLRSKTHTERAAEFAAQCAKLNELISPLNAAVRLADTVSEAAPAGVATVLVEGVRRPIEDLVVARERAGLYAALDAARDHAVQAVLHAREAVTAAEAAVAAFERVGD
jgi:hypothetical protein